MKNLAYLSILGISLGLLLTAFSKAYASPESINPDKTIYNLFDVYGRYYDYGEDEVKVYGVEFNKLGRTPNEKYEKRGDYQILPKDFYMEVRNISKAVFRAFPGVGRDYRGSAVHVGGNYILTNHHVLSPKRRNKDSCHGFEIKLNPNQKNKTLDCKKVHHCSEALDYCLIEMEDHRRGQSLSKQAPPVIKLSPKLSSKTNTMAIGNSLGFGIHASKGIGLVKTFEGLRFHAPVFGGNSGGGLFNEKGELIGIVRAQSHDLYSNASYNVAIDLNMIQADLKRALGEDSDALKAIKFKN